MILYVNACVRPDSRTNELARFVLAQDTNNAADVQEVNLQDVRLQPLDWSALRRRDERLASGRLNDDVFTYARQFALADEIVIGAPYWDLLFPALLRAYFEHVCVVGVTFAYTKTGEPQSLCRAKRLVYVSTAGGKINGTHLGFDYVKAIATQFFKIEDIRLVQAEGLDLVGANVQTIMEQAKNEYKKVEISRIPKN